MTVEFTKDMLEAWDARNITEFGELLDQDYVTRWGWVSTRVPREMRALAEYHGYLSEYAKSRAEAMGATIVDVDHPIIQPSTTLYDDTVIYTWKVRRD